MSEVCEAQHLIAPAEVKARAMCEGGAHGVADGRHLSPVCLSVQPLRLGLLNNTRRKPPALNRAPFTRRLSSYPGLTTDGVAIAEK